MSTVPGEWSFPWVMVRLGRTVLVWALAYPALICYWLIDAANHPGPNYADPWYPCAVLAYIPAMLATPFIWRDHPRMRVELRVEAGPRECTQADVSHARDSFFLTAHPYRRHIELNHVDCGYVGSFPAAIPFPVTDIDAAIEEHLGRSPT